MAKGDVATWIGPGAETWQRGNGGIQTKSVIFWVACEFLSCYFFSSLKANCLLYSL